MHEVSITLTDHVAGYKVCTTCNTKVHTLKVGCEVPHELCHTCGYSVVDKEAYFRAEIPEANHNEC